MVLEDRGVQYAMQNRECAREEYRELTSFNCTRQRLFGVDPAVGSFNMNTDRASNTGEKNVHPRSEYDPRTHNPPPTLRDPGTAKNGWPPAVKGGHIFDHIEPCDNPTRKSGALPRNIIGDCTVKDQFSSYYGHDSTYYGGNIGSRNARQYTNRFEKDPY